MHMKVVEIGSSEWITFDDCYKCHIIYLPEEFYKRLVVTPLDEVCKELSNLIKVISGRAEEFEVVVKVYEGPLEERPILVLISKSGNVYVVNNVYSPHKPTIEYCDQYTYKCEYLGEERNG